MTEVSCPLVGMHFHPPAKAILASAPANAPLVLIPEPDNPYDANAIQVWIAPGAVPSTQDEELTSAMAPMGFDAVSFREQERWLLGYVKRDYAEDLAPRLATMAGKEPGDVYAGKLAFGATGAPLVVVDLSSVTVPPLTTSLDSQPSKEGEVP